MKALSRVVVRFPDQLIKGFLAQEIDMDPGARSPDQLLIRLAETDEVAEVSLENAKAVFFVEDFGGAQDHTDLRFHDEAEPPGFLWVRLTFRDNEILEGMIPNGSRYVLESGFWVTPTDPTGNNLLIFVRKENVVNFEVLGTRQKATALRRH